MTKAETLAYLCNLKTILDDQFGALDRPKIYIVEEFNRTYAAFHQQLKKEQDDEARKQQPDNLPAAASDHSAGGERVRR